jgi:hypothetical protein
MKTVKAIGFSTLFAVTLFVGYVRHWSNIETSLALLCIVVLFLGVEITKLTEASSKTVRDNHAKIIKQIEEGQAVEPKHNPPASIKGSDDARRLFADFADFANKVNHQLDWGGWRLQDEPDGYDARYYTILYNGLNVGRLKLGIWGHPYKTADSQISAEVELSYLRLSKYSPVFCFLQNLVLLLCADTKTNFDRGMEEVRSHLVSYLWNAVRQPGSLPPFSMLIIGRPLNYFDQGEVHEESNCFWEDLRKNINATS